MCSKRVAGAIAAGLMLLPGIASALTTNTCSLNVAASQNWVPELVVVTHDEAKGKIIVADPVIMYFNDRQPVEGRIAVNNNKRITFNWELKASDASGQRATMDYRMTYLRGNNTVSIQAQPLGYESGYQATGICEVKRK